MSTLQNSLAKKKPNTLKPETKHFWRGTSLKKFKIPDLR
jgi:hypothetical protein